MGIVNLGKFVIFLSLLSFNNYMKQQQKKDIPKTVIKGSGGIGTDLSSLNENDKILFADPKCFIIGSNGLPHMIFVTPQFNANFLPIHLRESIFNIKSLIFKPSFFVGKKNTPVATCQMSPWIADFKHIEYLQLENVDIHNLKLLKGLPIRHISLVSVKFTNNHEIFEAIKHFKALKEISYDRSIPIELVQSIKKLNLKSTLLSTDTTVK